MHCWHGCRADTRCADGREEGEVVRSTLCNGSLVVEEHAEDVINSTS